MRTLDSGINLVLEFGKITNEYRSLIYSCDAQRKGNGSDKMKTTYLGISNHKFALKVSSSVLFKNSHNFEFKAVVSNQKGNLKTRELFFIANFLYLATRKTNKPWELFKSLCQNLFALLFLN